MKRVQRNGVIDPWKLIGVAYFNVYTVRLAMACDL